MGRAARRNHDPAGHVQRAQAAIAAATGGDGGAAPSVRSARPLQSLWAGYGTVIEAETDDEESQQLIIKEIGACRDGCAAALPLLSCRPPSPALPAPPLLRAAPPPGSGVSHLRKLRSYRVEAAFYQGVAPRLPPGAACHVARCLGVHSSLDSEDGSCGGGMQLVMADLREQFPSR